MKYGKKVISYLLVLAMLMSIVPLTLVTNAADVTVDNTADVIASVERADLTGTTTFNGASGSFSGFNLKGVSAGVYKVAYYLTIQQTTASGQLSLQPYGDTVSYNIPYETLNNYPNGKVMVIAIIRAEGDFTIGGSVATGLYGTVDKIEVTKADYDLGANAGQYAIIGEGVADTVPDGYIQPDDSEWTASVPTGLAATYSQQKNFISTEGNTYMGVFNAVGAPGFVEDMSFTNKDYFDETWDGLLAVSEQFATTTGLTSFIQEDTQVAKPDNGVGNDDFLVHWSGTVTSSQSTRDYNFIGTKIDNGVCIKVNDVTVYEYWGNGSWFDDEGNALQSSTSFSLTQNQAATIDIYYLELGGGEGLDFDVYDSKGGFLGLSGSTKELADAGFTFNLTATYYQAVGFVDSYGEFNDAIGAGGGAQSNTFEGNQNYDASINTIKELVSPVGTIRTDNFIISVESDFRNNASAVGCAGDNGILVEYNGYITAEEDGNYQFGLTKADNGCMVEIDGTRVIDYWGSDTYWDNGGATIYMDGKSVDMKAGESLPIKVVFLELGGGEGFTLNVKKDGGNEIAFAASGMTLSTIPLKGVVNENIPKLDATTDRELFYTDFTSTDNFTINGSPIVNTDKGIMIMESGDYISLGTDVLKDIGLTTTIEFVVKPSAIVEHAAFAGIGTNDDQNWVVMGMRSDGAVKYGMKTTSVEIGALDSGRTQGGLLAAGTWAIVKYVFEQNQVSVYVNGNLEKTWDIAGQKDLSQLTGDFVFGKELKWNDPGFSGTVSEVRVTSSEKVIRVRNRATNALVKVYTAADLSGNTLTLSDVEIDGQLPVAWYDGENNAVATAELGETVYVDLITIDYPISSGRSIRVSETAGNGLRFKATIKRGDFYNYFNEADADYVYSEDSDFTFGMLVIPANMLPDGEVLEVSTDSVLDIIGKRIYTQFTDEGDLEYTGVITDVPEEQFERIMLARPYIKYQFNGKTNVIYGETTVFAEYLNVARKVYALPNVDASLKADLVALFGSEDVLQAQVADEFAQNNDTQWQSYTLGENVESGISWPEGQALPSFATPAETLDSIWIGHLNADEQIAFSALQGLVNKTQPRIHLLEFETGKGNWINESTVNFVNRNTYNADTKYQLIAKYASELDGVVLYSTANSTHYRNLASTVAGLRNAIPVTAEVYTNMTAAGIDLPVVVDLTTLTYTSEADIYNHLYDNYWAECNRRLIVSVYPGDILTYVRDVATATGSAVVYLDCTDSTQQGIYEKFLKDMADDPSTSIALGWYTTERSGITTATKYGIGTVPADFYMSGTTFGGTDHTIQVPSVPTKNAVENKVYIAYYVSDGDNIQYVQGYMKELWDQSANDRGYVPINWTTSPALVDIGPGILNYYYTTATDKDCFVCGPSGIGYAMPYNTYPETGASTGAYLTDSTYLANYTKLSGTYFERAGLRVVTVWDQLNNTQRAAYEANARYLYGVTVQDFRYNTGILSGVDASTVNNLRFAKHEICYGQTYDDMYNAISGEIDGWNGNSPLFVSCQASVWGEMERPADINALYDALKAEYGDKFEFVRADHFFALYNEANGLDYNLCMDTSTKVTASDNSDTASVRDGSAYTLWTSDSRKDGQYVQFDLGANHSISRYVLRLAGANGMDAEYNVRDFHIDVSTDGNTWTTVDTYVENIANVVDVELDSAATARYVRIVIDDTEGDGQTRIADVEIYGK